jgi:hypothetical protein
VVTPQFWQLLAVLGAFKNRFYVHNMYIIYNLYT